MFGKSKQTEIATLVLSQGGSHDLTDVSKLIAEVLPQSLTPCAAPGASASCTRWFESDGALFALAKSGHDQITIAISQSRSSKQILTEIVEHLGTPLSARGVLWAHRPELLVQHVIDDCIAETRPMRAIMEHSAPIAQTPSALPSEGSALSS